MKKILAVALCLATPTAFAGTCAAPGTPITGQDTPAVVNGNSCGADATFGGGICSGSQFFDPATTVSIHQIEVAAGNAFNLVVADTAPYNAAIALVGPGACGPVAPCGQSGNDANAAGGGETLPDGGGNMTVGVGTYYAAVFSFDAGASGCGAYTLTVNPTLPVQLQSFSVG